MYRHTSGLIGVAFSPDGRRLASTSFDRTVRVWDAATGDEILALEGHTGGCIGVAFSPDGRRIASTSIDGTTILWDARPLRPEDGIEREALALVRRLVPHLRSKADVLERIRTDVRISEPVRRQALDYAEIVWMARVGQRAFRVVQTLFAMPRGKTAVRELLRQDMALSEEERQAALEVVDRWLVE